MNNTFNLLFNIKISHTYYKNNKCNDLTFNPVKSTKKLVNKYGLQIINTDSGFNFLTRKTGSNILELIINETNEEAFYFNPIIKNPSFYRITNAFSIKENSLLEIESVSKSNTLKHIFNNSIDVQQGITLKINFSDIIELQKEKTSHSFKLNFEARAVQWRYNFINNSGQNFENLSIKSNNNNNIVFNGLKKISLRNRQSALQLSSESLNIPLQEDATYHFDLLNNDIIILKDLPNANPDSIILYSNDGNTIEEVATMYIYI